ncbi:Uncharacterised protein [Mycobacterium tuberculosis]|uniref:Uncharacterized protein n=1 Tax=Mycobacterium tuberculosis TaxID=1773 RepID=A0A654Z8W6_MYCTX|nr:Uncharacterised protein [Mycobacterium tuberculosis]CKN67259.1 Uncharacterised protein [Mycobacterium tuberculosis]CKR59415.1 Uncharacterised protein [Mycobacterium tuberculosis]CKR88943.1 Uncharacterised protein [Mycobacterium tuberculosis]CKU54402.1 Uncharacterised protein [Mycobacterium tuberculosis]
MLGDQDDDMAQHVGTTDTLPTGIVDAEHLANVA